jgi:hypothetical protein
MILFTMPFHLLFAILLLLPPIEWTRQRRIGWDNDGYHRGESGADVYSGAGDFSKKEGSKLIIHHLQ